MSSMDAPKVKIPTMLWALIFVSLVGEANTSPISSAQTKEVRAHAR